MRDIIFYGAGKNAENLYGNQTGVSLKAAPPSLQQGLCFVDMDSKKIGGNYLGLPVLSIDEAITKYPQARFFVTLNEKNKYAIFHFLVNEKYISPDRIIGYVPVERRRSCLGDNTLTMFQQRMYLCWFDPRQNEFERPFINFKEDDYGKNVEDFIEFTKQNRIFRAEARNEEICQKCTNSEMGYFPVDVKYRQVNFMEFNKVKCNFKCSYCFWNRKGFDFDKSARELNFPLLVEELRKRSVLADSVDSCFGDGEITIHPKKSEYIQCLKDNNFSYQILTNGGIYDEEIAELLKTQYGFINVSMDSGTREYFRQIKGVDRFEQVIANCQRYTDYAKRKCIYLKYIFVVGKNCDDDNVNGFLHAAERIQPDTVILAFDFCDIKNEEMIVKSIGAVSRMLEGLEKLRINAWVDESIQNVLKNK